MRDVRMAVTGVSSCHRSAAWPCTPHASVARPASPLDLTRVFLAGGAGRARPVAGCSTIRMRRRLEPDSRARATCTCSTSSRRASRRPLRAARARATSRSRETLAPLLRARLLRSSRAVPRVRDASSPRRSPCARGSCRGRPTSTRTLTLAAPLSLLVLALHLKLVTQQHYLACVRGDESLEPHFVRLLKDHWSRRVRRRRELDGSALAIQQALGAGAARARPVGAPRLSAARLLVRRRPRAGRRSSTSRRSRTRRGAPLLRADRDAVVARAGRGASQDVPHGRHRQRRVRLCDAERSGPTAPAMLAGVVSALSVALMTHAERDRRLAS